MLEYEEYPEPTWYQIFVVLVTWGVLYLFLYFSVIGGTFAGVNPILLYWIPISVGAILSGWVGGNLYEFLFLTPTGKEITKRQVFLGLLAGTIMGAVVVFLLYGVSGQLQSIFGTSSIVPVFTSVDPIPLLVEKALSTPTYTSISQVFSSLFVSKSSPGYAFLLMLVVAVSEEFLVLMTLRPFEVYFLKKGFSHALAIVLAVTIAGILWAVAHTPAYSFEGIPLPQGIFTAFIIGTIFFRLMSEAIFKDMNLAFMIASHFAYDFLLISVVIPLSFVPV